VNDDLEVPVACDPSVFTPATRAEHDAALATTVLGRALSRDDRPDGITLDYPVDAALAAALLAWIVDERRCCPFLTFELRLDSGADRMRLAIRGPEGTREVLLAAFAS
jgi:hypothetical protein